MKKSRVIMIVILILGVLCVFASSWDGSAVVGAYGDFPLQGYYGACNSFPRNTIIDVTNLANNKTVTIIITRELSTTGILIALSPEAAQVLGITAGTTAMVRLTNPRLTGQTLGAVTPAIAAQDSDDLKKKAEAELARLGYAVTAPVSASQPSIPPTGTVTTTPAQPSQTTQVQPDTSQPRLVPQQSQVVGMPVPETKPAAVPSQQIPTQGTQTTQPAATPAQTAVPTATGEKPQVYDGKPKPIRTIIISGLPVPEVKPGHGEPKIAQQSQQLQPVQPQISQIPQTVAEQSQQLQTFMNQPELYTLISIPFNQIAGQKDVYAEPGVRAGETGVPYVRQAGSVKPIDVPYVDLPAPERERALVLERLGLLGTSLAFNLPNYAEPFVNPAERATVIDKTWFQSYQEPLSVALTEPEVIQSEGALVLERMGLPANSLADMLADSSPIELADPLLVAEELPVAYLSYKEVPPQTIPTVDLAESFVAIDDTTPTAVLSYQKPSMEAAETVIAMENVPLEDPKQQVVTVVAPQALPPGETVITMIPTTERPPQATVPSTTAPDTTQQPQQQTQVVQLPSATGTALQKGYFYIQIASFSTEAALQNAVKGLGNRYAVFIEKALVKGKTVYRLFMGPLKKDETGVALMYVRSLGYKDAFIKEGS